MNDSHANEVHRGERFEFGANWARFLRVVDDQRICMAEQSLKLWLGDACLKGQAFLDAGSGSGLFSLAARRLEARVHSFDYDPQSVACTRELRHRFFEGDLNWSVESGSVLDTAHLERLGRFDVVYSWGVLHHTGAMWQALANIAPLVAPSGCLFIAIYNDQGTQSRIWARLKAVYNRLPALLRPVFAALVLGPRELRSLAILTLKGRPLTYFEQIRDYSIHSMRGMSYWHDLIDWIGGYPFEVAKPEEIIHFCIEQGFELRKLRTCAGHLGCNEYLFVRRQDPATDKP